MNQIFFHTYSIANMFVTYNSLRKKDAFISVIELPRIPAYHPKIILKPTKEISKDKELVQKLTKNPFLTKKKICDLFEKRLRNFLDDEFEDYCTAEDYYQPVVEDFGDNLEYDLKKWCEQTGFEIVSCDGDGDDEGYEPKIKRGWY